MFFFFFTKTRFTKHFFDQNPPLSPNKQEKPKLAKIFNTQQEKDNQQIQPSSGENGKEHQKNYPIFNKINSPKIPEVKMIKKSRRKMNKEQEKENEQLRNSMKGYIVRSQRSTSVQRFHVMADVLHDPRNTDENTEPVAPIAAISNPCSESTNCGAGQKTNSGEGI